MIHPHTELRWINDHVGHGVVATQAIPKGTIIWTQCEFDIVLTPEQLSALSEPYRNIASTYAFVDVQGNTVLCWDNGRFVNHNCNPAMLSLGAHIDICVRDLQPGDELTCDYGILNYGQELHCYCGRADCRGSIRAEDALSLSNTWQARLEAALLAARPLSQPLLPYLTHPQEWEAYLAGTLTLPTPDSYFFERKGSEL